MLVFATSDKGGTGRSVTSANVLYRSALQGNDVCYVDFDFGAPTAGAIFDLVEAERGTKNGGLHSFLQGAVADPELLEIWAESDRPSLRERPPRVGRMCLVPGDQSGGEFVATPETVERCYRLFLRLDEEFDLTIVDLSAGRSHALEMTLAAAAMPALGYVRTRWLVFHRWTRQHVLAAAGLVYGDRGILDTGRAVGHDEATLAQSLRFVHTAVVAPDSAELSGLNAEQTAWLRTCDRKLRELSGRLRVGRSLVLGSVPLDPVLQWREQLITDNDVLLRGIARPSTRAAYEHLARQIADDAAWEQL